MASQTRERWKGGGGAGCGTLAWLRLLVRGAVIKTLTALVASRDQVPQDLPLRYSPGAIFAGGSCAGRFVGGEAREEGRGERSGARQGPYHSSRTRLYAPPARAVAVGTTMCAQPRGTGARRTGTGSAAMDRVSIRRWGASSPSPTVRSLVALNPARACGSCLPLPRACLPSVVAVDRVEAALAVWPRTCARAGGRLPT